MTDTENRRARLRSDVAVAARVVPTHYPLETFIAVNPLAGLEGMPFEQAIRRAGDLYGIRGVLDEEAFRRFYRDGRITDGDLDRALAHRFPNLSNGEELRLGERVVSPLEFLRADLLHGTPQAGRGIGTPQAGRQTLTRAAEHAPAVADIVDAQTSKWCAAFFGDAAWAMPGRENGFYSAWRALAAGDRSLPRDVRKQLRLTAERPDDAALEAISRLGINDDTRAAYLQAHLTRMPGWAAHIQWSAAHGGGIDLVGYLAMRLSYEAALLARHADSRGRQRHGFAAPNADVGTARERATHLIEVWGLHDIDDQQLATAARVLTAMPVTSRAMLWQNAFESHYRDDLLAQLGTGSRPAVPAPVHAQVVTCIDTRSEGLRRQLESLGGYETLGFAGFFAVAIRYTGLLRGASEDLCPVLIAPNHDITENPVPNGADAAARRVSGATRLAGAESAFHAAKESFAAPFTLAEAAGWIAAPLAAVKTMAPALSGAVRRQLRDAAVPAAPTAINLAAMPDEEQILFAQIALTTMGLTRGFSRLVVLCAHGSTTENNPYQAALDCGACGGQAGAPNARTAVAILNRPEVRTALESLGIEIPADTWFVAAQHDTAADRVAVLDTHVIPDSHRDDLARLERDFSRAGRALAAERCDTLPGASGRLSSARAARHVAGRSADWAQVYPEWGLAGNAAFLVAPREVSRGINLRRRVFLHSYDPDIDIDGAALEIILTAPLVVAQWINCQYYFSTVSPQVFGAGTKTIHNVVGKAGVIAGHTGDLQIGLPWQSVSDGQTLRHEPMRLLAVVQAPLDRIEAIIDRNPILQELFGNDWLALAAREDAEQPWHRWTRTGWRLWSESRSRPMILDEEMVS